MNNLFIVHYYPIEYYPPVMNLINSLEDKINITVSSQQKSNYLADFKGNQALIYRVIKENKSDRPAKIFIKYLLFTLYTLCKLISKRPDAVLYYESISALPVFLYKYLFSRSVKLCIHYHEYMTPSEYLKSGMRLARFNHKIEKLFLYKSAYWISQTNKFRKDFFLNDYSCVSRKVCHILPNYPSRTWHVHNKEHSKDGIIRCVYIGSLSLHDTFVEEFCKWVSTKKGRVIFDIYSFNFYSDVKTAISKLNSPYINFYTQGICYFDIPSILSKYDVGLLLYKANSLNFKYNETNKFYEYLICGLDVWYPKEMILLHELDKTLFVPNIVEFDFQNPFFPIPFLNQNIDNSSYDLFCENVYEFFIRTLFD